MSTGRNLRLLVHPRATLLHVLINIGHAVSRPPLSRVVTGDVNVRVISGGTITVDGTVEHLAPITVHAHGTGYAVRGSPNLKRTILRECATPALLS